MVRERRFRENPARRGKRARRARGARRATIGAAVTALVLLSGGCSAPGPTRPARIAVAPSGGEAELVFLARPAALTLAEVPAEIRAGVPEQSRRDAALGYQPRVALTANDFWPHPAPPRGERLYRFQASTSARSLVYFRGPEPVSRRGPGRGSYPAPRPR